MTLADEYERQERFRDWDQALQSLPALRGQRVLDIGCGVGTVTAQLAQGGAEVVGVDVNDALLARARERHPGLRFERFDAAQLRPDSFGHFDGIWCSFVAAYLPDLDGFVRRIAACLRDGGWLALIEVDDLLGHTPRSPALAAMLDAFYAQASAEGGYGFRAGRQLAAAASAAGLQLVSEAELYDRELSFAGPAPADVLDAWRARLARMAGLVRHFGARRASVSAELLDALAAPEHRALCRVMFVLARKP